MLSTKLFLLFAMSESLPTLFSTDSAMSLKAEKRSPKLPEVVDIRDEYLPAAISREDFSIFLRGKKHEYVINDSISDITAEPAMQIKMDFINSDLALPEAFCVLYLVVNE